jgi:hypothetical protein
VTFGGCPGDRAPGILVAIGAMIDSLTHEELDDDATVGQARPMDAVGPWPTGYRESAPPPVAFVGRDWLTEWPSRTSHRKTREVTLVSSDRDWCDCQRDRARV